MDAHLKEIFTNPRHPASFGGRERLLHYGRMKDPTLSPQDVRNFLASMEPYTLYKQNRIHFPRLKIRVKGANRILSVDLADMQRIAQYNDGHRYILVAVDAFSRYAWTVPLRSKSGIEVATALENTIFKDAAQHYARLHTDQGKEFHNHNVRIMLERYNSMVYSTFNSKIKAAHAERFIRTLKGRLYRALNMANSWR